MHRAGPINHAGYGYACACADDRAYPASQTWLASHWLNQGQCEHVHGYGCRLGYDPVGCESHLGDGRNIDSRGWQSWTAVGREQHGLSIPEQLLTSVRDLYVELEVSRVSHCSVNVKVYDCRSLVLGEAEG